MRTKGVVSEVSLKTGDRTHLGGHSPQSSAHRSLSQPRAPIIQELRDSLAPALCFTDKINTAQGWEGSNSCPGSWAAQVVGSPDLEHNPSERLCLTINSVLSSN